MLVCASIVGAMVVTTGWMFGISYVDYLVARHRRFEGRHHDKVQQQLTVERLFAMPWNQVSWLASGGVVLALAFVSGLLGFGVFLLTSVAGVAIVSAIVLSDWQQLQRPQVTPSASPVARVTGPATPEAWLYGIRGEYTGCHIQLDSRGLSIGRSASNALRLSDRSISRSHALIRFGRGRWFLQDQNSTAGTFVNGQRVNATALNPGDRIRIGPTEFEFRLHWQGRQ